MYFSRLKVSNTFRRYPDRKDNERALGATGFRSPRGVDCADKSWNIVDDTRPHGLDRTLTFRG